MKPTSFSNYHPLVTLKRVNDFEIDSPSSKRMKIGTLAQDAISLSFNEVFSHKIIKFFTVTELLNCRIVDPDLKNKSELELIRRLNKRKITLIDIGITTINQACDFFIKTREELTRLDLTKFRIDDSDITMIHENFRNIKQLHLKDAAITDFPAEKFKNLKVLELSNCIYPGNCDFLKNLHLEELTITDDTVPDLSFLDYCKKTLKKLDLSECKIEDNDYQRISLCSLLNDLNVSCTSFHDTKLLEDLPLEKLVLPEIKKFILPKDPTKLKELSIILNCDGNELDSIKQLTQLETLKLCYRRQIGQDKRKVDLSLLQRLSSLKKLYLYGVDPFDIRPLAVIPLEHLYIEGPVEANSPLEKFKFLTHLEVWDSTDFFTGLPKLPLRTLILMCGLTLPANYYDVLSKCTSLTHFVINANSEIDCEFDLKCLEGRPLEQLNLYYFRSLKNLDILKSFTNLKVLTLEGTLENIQFLNKMPLLEFLDLRWGTEDKDFSPIGKCKLIKKLILGYVDNLGFATHLKLLEEIDLHDSFSIEDPSPLENHKILRKIRFNEDDYYIENGNIEEFKSRVFQNKS